MIRFFGNNFRSALFTCRRLRISLCLIHTKPPPAGCGGPIPCRDAPRRTGLLPLGRRADGPPSRRVAEPTSRRARKRQEFEPPSSAPTPRTAQDAPRECEVRTAPCPGFRLLSSPTHSHAWPFAVARATQVCRRNHNQSGTVWRAIALARSDHPAATGESDPSVTLPRTSPPAIVWYQQAPIIQSDPAIGVTDTSASRAWVHVGQPAPKTALKASHKALYRPEECLGSHGARPRQRGLVTNRHKSSCHVTILRFWPAISEPGWARRKKVPLGVRLKSTRPSEIQERARGKFPWGEIQNDDVGCERSFSLYQRCFSVLAAPSHWHGAGG